MTRVVTPRRKTIQVTFGLSPQACEAFRGRIADLELYRPDVLGVRGRAELRALKAIVAEAEKQWETKGGAK